MYKEFPAHRRYDSRGSMSSSAWSGSGTNAPLNAKAMQALDESHENKGFIGSAWDYTLGTLSGVSTSISGYLYGSSTTHNTASSHLPLDALSVASSAFSRRSSYQDSLASDRHRHRRHKKKKGKGKDKRSKKGRGREDVHRRSLSGSGDSQDGMPSGGARQSRQASSRRTASMYRPASHARNASHNRNGSRYKRQRQSSSRRSRSHFDALSESDEAEPFGDEVDPAAGGHRHGRGRTTSMDLNEKGFQLEAELEGDDDPLNQKIANLAKKLRKQRNDRKSYDLENEFDEEDLVGDDRDRGQARAGHGRHRSRGAQRSRGSSGGFMGRQPSIPAQPRSDDGFGSEDEHHLEDDDLGGIGLIESEDDGLDDPGREEEAFRPEYHNDMDRGGDRRFLEPGETPISDGGDLLDPFDDPFHMSEDDSAGLPGL